MRSLSVVFGVGVLALSSSDAAARQAVKIAKPFGTCAKGGKGRVPATLDEAMGELKRILGAAQVARFKKADPIGYHHGLGTALRNCWGLWAGSALAKWFVAKGIRHPDDMSGIVLTSFHRQLNGKPIGLKQQIARYKAYWNKQKRDYEKGTSSGRSLFHVVSFVKNQGWVSLKGDNIPRITDLVVPLIAHAKGAVKACWRKFPKTPGNAAVDIAIKIAITRAGRLGTATVVRTAIPAKHAACMARALVGASIPKHAGARYTLVLQSYRTR